MVSEDDLAESGTSSPATSTSQVSRAARPGASENLRCPICRAPMNDRASVSWRRHPFCFYCMVEWFNKGVDGVMNQSLFQHAFHVVGGINSEVQCIGESTSSASHTLGERAGSRSAERRQHHSSGRQHSKSYSRSCCGSRGGSRGGSQGGSRGGSRGGSHGGSRGGSCRGSRGRAQEKSRSRCPRRHHNGRTRVRQAHGYSHSSSRRRQQSRVQNTARDKSRDPRTKVRALSRRRKRRQQEYQVSFIEPRAIRSRSRQRSRSSTSRTLREYLRKMERDEGRALRHDWYMRASSGRSRCQQQRQRLSYREPQVTRSQTPRRFHSMMAQKKNPRRMEFYERQPLRTEHASPRRSERLQQGQQASFIKPQLTGQSQERSHSTQHQTQQENQRRMECDEGQALRPEGDIPTSSGWSERHQRGRRISFTES